MVRVVKWMIIIDTIALFVLLIQMCSHDDWRGNCMFSCMIDQSVHSPSLIIIICDNASLLAGNKHDKVSVRVTISVYNWPSYLSKALFLWQYYLIMMFFQPLLKCTCRCMQHWLNLGVYYTMWWFLPLVLVSLWTQSISWLSFATQTIFSSKTLACGLSLWGSSSSGLHQLFHLSSPESPSMAKLQQCHV